MPPDLCVAGGLHGFVSMRGCFFIASEAKTIIWRAHGPRLEKGKDGEEWRSVGHRAALGQLCSQSRFQLVAESNQTPPVWVPSGLLAGQETVPAHSRAIRRAAWSPAMWDAFVPPSLSFLPPPLPAFCVCITPSLPTAPAWFSLPSPIMSSSPFSSRAAPRTSTASQTPPLSLPASPHALLSLSVSPSLTVWGNLSVSTHEFHYLLAE